MTECFGSRLTASVTIIDDQTYAVPDGVVAVLGDHVAEFVIEMRSRIEILVRGAQDLSDDPVSVHIEDMA